ncbi:unnamed protein product [Amoebophrya sp. A25]|nr:unnamed protein product [Amoebophrya sp. A25]|eukprot:GSA25T00003536001.1
MSLKSCQSFLSSGFISGPRSEHDPHLVLDLVISLKSNLIFSGMAYQ